MKPNPTAYDLLLAYAECVETWSTMSTDRVPEATAKLEALGWNRHDMMPIGFINDLRRRALDAARKEAEDGK